MAKSEIATAKTNQLPAFISEDKGAGLDGIDKYIRPQRIKIVQKTSGDAYSSYDSGTLLLTPEMTVFAKNEKGGEPETFQFVPLLFFPEYLKINPLGMDPFVAERSLDPNSSIAKRAINPDLRTEAHPDKEGAMIKYREVLNFIVMPYPATCQFFGTPIVLSFSSSSHRDGEKLLSLLKRRRMQGAPIYANIFEGRAQTRQNTFGTWYALDVQNPEAGEPFVGDKEVYEILKSLYDELNERREQIVVEHEDESAATTTEF